MTTQEQQRQELLRDFRERREKKRLAKQLARKRRRIAAAAVLVAVSVTTTGIVYHVSAKEISLTEINDFDGVYETKTIKTHTSSVDKLLESEGISVSEADRLNVAPDAAVNDNDAIVLTRGKKIKIKTNQGEQFVNVTKADATDALVEAGYIPGERDEITQNGDTIELVEVSYREETQKESIPFDTEYIDDYDLPEGETKVIFEGYEGIKEITSQVIYRDGVEFYREVIGEDITAEPGNKVIAKGAAKPSTPEPAKPVFKASAKSSSSDSTTGTINGRRYKKKINMTATAYSTAPSENGGYSVSAMGSPLDYGIVAVDPSVVPLGSTVYVTSADGSWTYGVASAEDTGGAIKGNTIDLCYSDKTSWMSGFGRRSCVVYILE